MPSTVAMYTDANVIGLGDILGIVAVTMVARPGAPRGCHRSRAAYLLRTIIDAPPELYRSDVSVSAETAAGVKKARQPHANID